MDDAPRRRPTTAAEREYHRLAKRHASLRDASLRVAYIAHRLRELPPPAVTEIVAVAVTRAQLKEPPHPELFLSISVALASESTERRQELARIAASRGQLDLLRIMGDGAQDAPDPRHRREDGRPLTLGERKSLARRPDRALIGRALADSDPQVVRIVLDNPGVTEDNVVRFCARRDARPSSLRTVFRHPRWVVRYRVRRALVLNPACPLEVSLALVLHLREVDRRLVLTSPQLAEELRSACEATAPLVH